MTTEANNPDHASDGRLFTLPEYEKAFARFVHQAMHELMTHKSPLLSRIKTVAASSIPTVRNTMPSGEVVENSPIRMALPFTVEFKDAISGNLESITTSIDSAAEEGLRTLMPQIYGYMGRLCEAAGTATDARGEPLSHDLIRRSLENVDIDFDENGEPQLPTMVVSPEMAQSFQRLPPPTEEEKAAWDALIKRKRQEHDDRRHRRQLS